MPDSPAKPEAPRPRKWGRRTAVVLLSILTGVSLLAAGTWAGRVALLNHFLAGASPIWKVRIEGLEWPATGLVLRGLRVAHVDQAGPVFTTVRVSVSSGWRELRQGRLGNVTVDSPAVFWRSRLRTAPGSPAGAAAPGLALQWDSLAVSGGTLDAAAAGGFSCRAAFSSGGGAGAWHPDGRLQLDHQSLEFQDPAYALNLTSGAVGRLECEASRLTLTGKLDAATGLLTLTRPQLAAARLTLTGPGPSPASEPATVAAADRKAGMISGVSIDDLTAPGLKLTGAVPWQLSGAGDFMLARLVSAPGQPLEIENAALTAGSLTLPDGLEIPHLELAAGWRGEVARLDRLSFKDAAVADPGKLLIRLGLPAGAAPEGSFQADGEFRDLSLTPAGPASVEVQSLALRGLKLTLPSGQGTVTVKQATLTAVPDEVAAARRLRSLTVLAPEADLTVTAPSVAPSAAPEPASPTAAAAPSQPWWEGWKADTLTVSGGRLAATLPQAGGARVTTALAAATLTPGTAETPASYQITLGQPSLVHPQFPDQPIALAAAVQMTASIAGLWQKREIDALTLSGTRLQIGDALFRLVNALPPVPPAAPEPPPRTSSTAPLPPWKLKSLVLEEALVRIDNLGAGSQLDIPVKRQEFHDLPLDAGALAAVDRRYKVEVPRITLFNPWVPGQKVAVLDTNYIEFTPSGLLQRKLERVDLMSPSLYAGQPLFDFVEAARRRFTDLAAVPAPAPRPLLVDLAPRSPTLLSALASVTPTAAAAAAKWSIPFYTATGKVLVAPKGFPWPNLPVIPFRNARDAAGKPIPFELHGGTFHGELAIEPGWYDFPEYKVRLRLSDRGRIIFNTPQRDRDNNLTEVFENNTIIFRQLQVDEAWLSVTYDARGIYARFGGRTCGGTLSGSVNLYLDELYTWDAWASLTGIGMEPLTDKLTPDTFRMTGPVDALTVKAYGDTTSLYQAALDLKVSQPGHLHLLALDTLKQRVEALGGLSADLGKISLSTLRDFAYTGCSGALKLFGSEGEGQLRLTGSTGSRTFQLRLHDYRGRTPGASVPF